jgi:hypothetical protein
MDAPEPLPDDLRAPAHDGRLGADAGPPAASEALERLGLRPLVEAFERGLRGALWGVALFGSAARGEETEQSDLDLLVVADGVPEQFGPRGSDASHGAPRSVGLGLTNAVTHSFIPVH